jgi:hypothetical protein
VKRSVPLLEMQGLSSSWPGREPQGDPHGVPVVGLGRDAAVPRAVARAGKLPGLRMLGSTAVAAPGGQRENGPLTCRNSGAGRTRTSDLRIMSLTDFVLPRPSDAVSCHPVQVRSP